MALINWFPGHMAQAKKNLSKALASVDVVVEVLDARMPAASANPLFEELRKERQRPALKVLNKADLADPHVTEEWVSYFLDPTSLASALPIVGKSKQEARKTIQQCQKLAPHRTDAIKPLRLIVTGVPNVGKSTILNGLLGQAKAKAADEPAAAAPEDLAPTYLSQACPACGSFTLFDAGPDGHMACDTCGEESRATQ